MDLDKITYLLALTDTKNYSRAAETCHICNLLLARYIKNLEERIKCNII